METVNNCDSKGVHCQNDVGDSNTEFLVTQNAYNLELVMAIMQQQYGRYNMAEDNNINMDEEGAAMDYIPSQGLDYTVAGNVQLDDLYSMDKNLLLQQEQGEELSYAAQSESVPAGQGVVFSALFRDSMNVPKDEIPENLLMCERSCQKFLGFNQINVEENIGSTSPLKFTNMLTDTHSQFNLPIASEVSLNGLLQDVNLYNYELKDKIKKTSAVESMEVVTGSDGFEQNINEEREQATIRHDRIKKEEDFSENENNTNCSKAVPAVSIKCEYMKEESRISDLIDKDGDTPFHIYIAKYYDKNTSQRLKNGTSKDCANYLRLNQQFFKPYVNIANHRRQTPLHMAVFIADEELVQVLVEFGATLKAFDEHLNTPLHIAFDKSIINRREILELILKCSETDSAIVDALNDKGLAAIHLATETGDLELMKLLSRYGAELDIQEAKTGYTSLMKIIERGLVQEGGSTKQNEYFKLAKLMVTQLKADVNVVTYSLDSPLHFACLANNIELVKTLLNHGAVVNEKNINRRTEKDLTTDKEIKDFLEPMFRRKRRKRLLDNEC